MLRNHLKTIVSRVWPAHTAPCVIFYHSVHPAMDLSIEPALFAEHLDWLLDNDFQIVKFSELVRRVLAGDAPSKLVCITFDDGYADNFEYAVPILMQRQIPATFFVVTGLMGDSNTLLSNSRNHLYNGRVMLTKAQLREMQARGLEIGSHTRSHVHVRKTLLQSESTLMDELVGSRKDLEDCLGTTVTCFAYPYGQKGFFDNNTTRHVQAAGYQYAATTIWGHVTSQTHPLEVPRMEIKCSDSLAVFKSKMMGKFDYLRYYELAFDRSAKWQI